MKKSLILLVMSLMLLSSMINVIGHGGETHTTDSDDTSSSNDGFSLTLEQIYVITIMMAIIMAFILENQGIIKDRGLVYKFIGFGLFFLTADYVIYKEYFA